MRGALPRLAWLTAGLGMAVAPVVAQSTHPAKGTLLIATDRTRDTAFAQTVVLLVEHDGAHSTGLALNRMLGERVGAVFPALRKSPAAADPMWAGGPVAIGINALVAGGGGRSAVVTPGVALVSERRRIEELLSHPAAGRQLRIYVGLCSWGPGQLEDEIERRLWRVSGASAAVVFDSRPDTLWQRLSTAARH